MKKTLTILLLLIGMKGYPQSIDKIVSDISSSQIDSFSRTLDSAKVLDTATSQTFYIDTIKLNSGEFKIFSISITGVQTNGTSIFRTMYLYYACLNNIAGSYFLKLQGSILVTGITNMTISTMLINNNTLCVVKITLPLNKQVKIHYRRQET